MRKFALAMAAATVVASASLAPAHALAVGTAPALEAAIAETDFLHEAAYVCRHRFYTSRRLCWWRPALGHRGWRWRRR